MRYDYEDTEDYVLHRLFLIISILHVIKCQTIVIKFTFIIQIKGKVKNYSKIYQKKKKKLCLNVQNKMSKVVRQAACSSCSQQQSGCKSIWAHMACWRHKDWSLQTDNLHLNITGSRYGFETAGGNSHFITETSCLCVSSSSVAQLPTIFCHISLSLSLSLKRRFSSCFIDYTLHQH